MKENEFIQELKAALEITADISPATNLNDLDEWDSLAYVSYIALINEKFGITIPNDQLRTAKTVGDLVGFVKAHLEN